MTGQVSSRHLATFSSSRSAARRAGIWAVHYADLRVMPMSRRECLVAA
jgi:hypothetical protein